MVLAQVSCLRHSGRSLSVRSEDSASRASCAGESDLDRAVFRTSSAVIREPHRFSQGVRLISEVEMAAEGFRYLLKPHTCPSAICIQTRADSPIASCATKIRPCAGSCARAAWSVVEGGAHQVAELVVRDAGGVVGPQLNGPLARL
jgi:hypothetical protein